MTAAALQAPAPLPAAEVATASPWCQRWTRRAHSWRHIGEGGFDQSRYRVEPITESAAWAWIVEHHYSGSYPAASQRYGLFDRAGQLLGACVLGVPMTAAVLTNVFPDLCPVTEALDLSRLVLADHVPANAESWFIARAFAAAAELGVRGVVAFADPVPRRMRSRVLFPGHTGHIYVASNAVHSGAAPPGRSPCCPTARSCRPGPRRRCERASAATPMSSGSSWP
jgi:hypothetical protein